ncbi:hypothetical protein [Thaumasiovibrio subtropicus]|uniref:hypothetical protein n=1 Tax=Thaumasiovibrio subtropicus TaxID=1891207 RepID=UPI0018647E30|nr:hypothetical protein [Thaumasiovibrio subtropicus]
MADNENYQVAIDILRCHLGMSVEQAHKELGIQAEEHKVNQQVIDIQEALMNINDSK